MLIYKKKNQFKNKTAIVLGSDGLIGKEIVKNLIDLDCRVIKIEIKKKDKKKIKKDYFFLDSNNDLKQIKQFNHIKWK